MEKTTYWTCPHCCQMIEVKAEGTEITNITVSKDTSVGSCGEDDRVIKPSGTACTTGDCSPKD